MARKALETRNKEEEKETINIKSIESKLDKYLEKKVDELTESLSKKIDERIEFKSNKFWRDEEKKIARKNRFKIVRLNVIIIVLLGIICYFGYCLYDVDFFHIRTMVIEKDNEINKNIESSEESSGESSEEKNEIDKSALISEYSYLLENLFIEDEAVFDIFKDSINKNNISNDLKLKISYKNLDESYIENANDVISFDARYLEETNKKIFGKDSSLKYETFTYNKMRFMYYNGVFIGLKEDNVSNLNILKKIEDINLEGNKLQFYLIIGKLSPDGELLDESGNVILEKYNSEDLSTYKDKLSTFVVTFDKVGESYIFSSIDKISENKGVV